MEHCTQYTEGNTPLNTSCLFLVLTRNLQLTWLYSTKLIPVRYKTVLTQDFLSFLRLLLCLSICLSFWSSFSTKLSVLLWDITNLSKNMRWCYMATGFCCLSDTSVHTLPLRRSHIHHTYPSILSHVNGKIRFRKSKYRSQMMEHGLNTLCSGNR